MSLISEQNRPESFCLKIKSSIPEMTKSSNILSGFLRILILVNLIAFSTSAAKKTYMNIKSITCETSGKLVSADKMTCALTPHHDGRVKGVNFYAKILKPVTDAHVS